MPAVKCGLNYGTNRKKSAPPQSLTNACFALRRAGQCRLRPNQKKAAAAKHAGALCVSATTPKDDKKVLREYDGYRIREMEVVFWPDAAEPILASTNVALFYRATGRGKDGKHYMESHHSDERIAFKPGQLLEVIKAEFHDFLIGSDIDLSQAACNPGENPAKDGGR